jgi:aminoglycoside phosphotransferase (APT) family kinase protein
VTTPTGATTPLDVLLSACAKAGLDASGAEPIRLGENAIFRLTSRVVVRIGRRGQSTAAEKEVRVARWFDDHSVPAVRALPGVAQPLEVEQHPVTFWEELPPHRHGTAVEVAVALRQLHDLPVPDGLLGPLDPFVRLSERIDVGVTLAPDDRAWLREHLDALREQYRTLPAGMAHRVVHGDAWGGNIVTTDDGRTVLLDLERCSVGPPEWDLVSIALRRGSFGWLSDADYQSFAIRYGHDVTEWTGYELLRDIRELRMALYRVQRAAEHPGEQAEAQLRVACLRGRCGPRPWNWGG